MPVGKIYNRLHNIALPYLSAAADLLSTTAQTNTKVLILSAYPESAENFVATEARDWLSSQTTSTLELVNDPKEAELILFMEHHPGIDPLFLRVFLHPFRLRWPYKCFLFHDADHVFPLMPGIYPGLENRYSRNGSLASWLYTTQFCVNSAVQYAPLTGDELFLYSFLGAARTHPVRRELMKIDDSRALLKDTSRQNGWELTELEQSAYHDEYARILRQSTFVLCPRGISPTSYRLLEAMKTGRSPVIISDGWLLPEDINWSDFSITVRESDINIIPDLLRERESDAHALGSAARKAWEIYCSDETKYARLLERFCKLTPIRSQFSGFSIHLWLDIIKSRDGLRALWRSLRNYPWTKR